ncbi:MAG: adenylate/guanylate cyclase domain-containing protein [Gammaproteobacteria bacterium]|nr:adenylate/guanylate cyclase domain-containing protein [Gammaproteobacteria bacterium]
MKARKPQDTSSVDNALIDELTGWLMSRALGETRIEDLFRGCCERLNAADVPVIRGALGFRTLHPLFRAVTLVWRPGQEIEVTEHPHGPVGADFRQSPHYYMLHNDVPLLRRRLEGDSATLDFPVLSEFRQGGATDYFAYAIPFGELNPQNDRLQSDGVIGSWLCNRPGGYTEHDIRILRRVQQRLAVGCKVGIKTQIAKNILDAYLGPATGRRVYEGRISRGSGENIHAVIWFSDLRASTQLSQELSTKEFLGVLNAFFESVADAVLDGGGEVLRFIGDAMLAIFPMEHHTELDPRECPAHREACEKAMTAARDAIERMQVLNEERAARSERPIGYGIGLHVGDVMYGNIGVPRRVEFSVVGHAANHAAKLESLCKILNVPLLVSRQFADIQRENWKELGEHAVDGTGPQQVFTLPELQT